MLEYSVLECPSLANQILAFGMNSSSSFELSWSFSQTSRPAHKHSFILSILTKMVLPRTSAFGSMFRSYAARTAKLRSTTQTWRTAGRRTYASGHGPAKKSSDLPWCVNSTGSITCSYKCCQKHLRCKINGAVLTSTQDVRICGRYSAFSGLALATRTQDG